MSIYENEISTIYAYLNPTVPKEPQAYRLKKLTDIEAYLLDEIEQKHKRFNTVTRIIDLSLITSTVIAGEVSFAEFASGNGLTVGIALSRTSLIFSLATAITRKCFKIFTIKKEKHGAIKLLAQSKLDSIANITSQ